MARTRSALKFFAVALVCLVVAIAGGYLYLTRTQAGRTWIASYAVQQVNSLFEGRGTLTIGSLSHVAGGSVSASNIALRDTAGLDVVTVRQLSGRIRIGALLSKTILLTDLHVDGVTVDMRKDFVGPWNIAYITVGDSSVTETVPTVMTGFGDDVRVQSLTVSNLLLKMSAPWEPSSRIPESMRDSVIAMRKSLHDVIDLPGGMIERRQIELARAVAHDVVLVAPGSTPASMKIDSLQGRISDPPVELTYAQGQIQWTGDSLNLDVSLVRLPVSEGSARGRVWWNEPGAVRYDVAVQARAGLSDLQWIWDALPTEGNGGAKVRMRTLADAEDAEFAIEDLTVQSGSSNIKGKVTVTVTPLELALSETDLVFDPLESSLARRLSYDALPPEVRGLIRGRLVAKTGGPLTALLIDRIEARFDDANVAGATSTVVAAGKVSIGATPAATNTRVLDSRIDLRTIAAIAPSVPEKLDGVVTVKGLIRQASLTQADIRGLSVSWTDGVGNTSAISGDLRGIFSGNNRFVDAQLNVEPLSMSALSRIDTALNVYSTISGTVQARGPLDSITWNANLAASEESRVTFAGTAAVLESGWRVRTSGNIQSFNVSDWLGRTDMPATALTGNVALNAVGGKDSTGVVGLREMKGDLSLKQEASFIRPEFGLVTGVQLTDTRLLIDSARAELGGIVLSARGALARDSVSISQASDTVEFSFDADSIGAAHQELRRLARMLQPVDSSMASTVRSLVEDSVNGVAVGSGYLYGSVPSFSATFSFGGRDLRVGNVLVSGLFGSALVTDLPTTPRFETAATATEIDGIGAIRVATAEFRIGNADPARGDIVLNVASLDTSKLVVRGEYRRATDSLTVVLDSLRFDYGSVRWANRAPVMFHDTRAGLRLDSLLFASNEGGVLEASANVPVDGAVSGKLKFDQFPAGELYAFAMASKPFAGLLSGEAFLAGTRVSPSFEWNLRVDSLGTAGYHLPQITSDGAYLNRRLVARAMLADTLGGSLAGEMRVPIDLSIRSLEQRLLSDSVDADLFATQLQLGALGMNFPGVERLSGIMDGRLQLAGTLERPFAQGQMAIDGFSAQLTDVGIAPVNGRIAVRASGDSLILDNLRFRSGGNTDTVSASGAVRMAKGEPATMRLQLHANNTLLAHLRDGTRVIASADLSAAGPLRRPVLSGRVFIPEANIVADPFGASTALDLNTAAARELLGTDEVPVAETAAESFARLGKFLSVRNARVDFGDEVWVNTPEAAVRVTGGVAVVSSGETIAPEGEISASRGTYQLNLGVVRRTFSIDSGSVRFYGNPAIPATVDITATNVVRSSGSSQIPVRVHIGGTLDIPVLTLSSPDPLYSGAPDSEIISLLIFGAPTFALDGKSQSTVRAVAGVLVPTVGGALEGTLQRLLPFQFNTLQIQTAGGARDDLTAMSLIDNLSIAAGKQLGDRTFLRLNTGVCGGSGAAASARVSLWAGFAVEYLLAPQLTAQVGVDPGTSPCSRLSGDVMPRMQFGFDLFRDWVF